MPLAIDWPQYHKMMESSLAAQRLSHGVNAGLITQIHKGGTCNPLNQWRSITLLNLSYKLLAKAVQLLLQPILMNLISFDQSAFLPLRFILNNISLTHETISHATRSNQPLLFQKIRFH